MLKICFHNTNYNVRFGGRGGNEDLGGRGWHTGSNDDFLGDFSLKTALRFRRFIDLTMTVTNPYLWSQGRQ